MRTYQAAWERLKLNGTLTVSAPKRDHLRWRKAISKEKNELDAGYKLVLEELGFTAKIVVAQQTDTQLVLELRFFDALIPYSAKEL